MYFPSSLAIFILHCLLPLPAALTCSPSTREPIYFPSTTYPHKALFLSISMGRMLRALLDSSVLTVVGRQEM